MKLQLALVLFAGLCGSVPASAATAPWVSADAGATGFALVREGRAASLWCDSADHAVVRSAAADLAADVERVTGTRPLVNSDVSALHGPAVLIGTLGHSPLIDDLVRRKRLDVRAVKGQWETFLIATVPRPLPAVSEALVIVGSDRRGTAFGAYELSQAIGVSPWYFWADVAPDPQRALVVAPGTRRFGPPSVRYRGIFLNDEDWGLQRWAARSFDPETGDIGPKTYRRVFELLLRLKANTLWPAMHACTRPFNADPANARLADEYAIVMGSSHAEPMLRNNVREWTAPHPDYNYVTNREGVRAYWEERVRANGRFENIYTLGMRGIHDSDIQGTRSAEERVRVLEEVFADQRALLAQHVAPRVERLPQMFCAYKEVLALYRAGLKVPDDVTIVWPDDNFGFIRSFASAPERRRAGGFGVYYHISYLGSPLAYLWLQTTPPALIWEELNKAYDHGADRIWIVNVGDIKPAEIGTELFLQMAWDIGRWRRDNLPRFLAEWATREFGGTQAAAIADVMAEYYRLNFQRKPEHLQWWRPAEKPRSSALAPHEIRQRLEAFTRLREAADRIYTATPEPKRDALYQLVVYPVRGAALANERFFAAEEHGRQFASDNASARAWAARSRLAASALEEETRYFNERLAGGKWRHMLALEPADTQWRSMRIAPTLVPAENMAAANAAAALAALTTERLPAGAVPRSDLVSIEAEHFAAKGDRAQAAWQVIPGLGHSGDSVAVFPTTAPSIDIARAASEAPSLEYALTLAGEGEYTLTAFLLPTHPLAPDRGLRFAVALDAAPPRLVVADVADGSPEWALGVLNGMVTATAPLSITAPGRHTLRVFMIDAGVVLDKLVIHRGELPPSYLGPTETAMPRPDRAAASCPASRSEEWGMLPGSLAADAGVVAEGETEGDKQYGPESPERRQQARCAQRIRS